MAGLDMTAIDKILKDVYVPLIREQMQKSTVLLSQVQRTSENITSEGKKAIIALMLGFNEGIGARGDEETLPTAKYSRYERIEIPIVTTYGRIYVSGKAIRQSRSDAGAFTRAIDSEMKNMFLGLKRDINRQLFGDGTGALATVSGNQSSVTTITVSNVKYFRVGMSIDIHESTPITNREITAINTTNRTITISGSAVNVTNGTIITRNGSRDREMYGLTNIVNTTNWLLNPSSVPEWSAYTTTLPGSYTSQQMLDKLQEAYSACEERGEEAPNLIVTTFTIRDIYASALTTLRRIVNKIEVDFSISGSGRQYLEFNGVPIVPDAQCPDSVLYMLNTKRLVISVGADFDWADEDGKILDKVPDRDAYTAFMYFDGNFATDRRNAHSRVTGW